MANVSTSANVKSASVLGALGSGVTLATAAAGISGSIPAGFGVPHAAAGTFAVGAGNFQVAFGFPIAAAAIGLTLADLFAWGPARARREKRLARSFFGATFERAKRLGLAPVLAARIAAGRALGQGQTRALTPEINAQLGNYPSLSPYFNPVTGAGDDTAGLSRVSGSRVFPSTLETVQAASSGAFRTNAYSFGGSSWLH